MDDLTRRDAIQRTAGAGLIAALVPGQRDAAAQAKASDVPDTERGRMIAVGMTEDEADCWVIAAKLAGKFFDLPELHPMDKQEVATAIHVIQNKLLGRPSYRRYLGPAKAVAPK